MTKIAVVIASTGRPTELARWVEHCAAQTLQPSDLVLSIAQAADLPVDFQQGSAVVVAGRQGSSAQRNSGIAALSNKPDILAFFDDDYVPSRFCLAGIAQLYAAEPDVVAASGRLLADGINGPGIDFSEARAIVDDFDIAFSEPNLGTTPATSTYGCNMTFRYSAIGDERFDERLLLYGWQEDVDFSARVGLRGKVVFTGAYVGVHQGAKRGRTSGKRFGYSQIANPIYLHRKGTMSFGHAYGLMLRNIVQNIARSPRPEPWVDRRGRLAGNARALFDVLRGNLMPEAVLEI